MSTPSRLPKHEPPERRRRRNWTKIVAWTAASLLVLTAGALIGLVMLLQNGSFRQYLLRVTHDRISEALGTNFRMRDFSLHLSGLSPTVDMYDVAIDGAAPYQEPPLLKVDHLAVGVQIVSVVQRKWYLSDIVIDHPVAHILVDANGNTNLPRSQSTGESQTSVFDLGIRHMMLGQGEVFYNDRKSVLDADLHDLNLQSSFDVAQNRYTGGLSYHDGQLHFQDLNPVVHSLEAEFDAASDAFNLKRGTVTSGASRLNLTAVLNDYVHPRITGSYDGLLDSGELRQIVKDVTLPVGVIHLSGSGQLEVDASQSVLQTLSLAGNIDSAALQVHSGAVSARVRDISAQYTLRNGNVELRNARARLLGGTLAGDFTMRDLAAAQQSEVHAVLHNVALSELQTLIDTSTHTSSQQQPGLSGTADATVVAAWHKDLKTLVARADASLKGSIAASQKPASAAADASGNIQLSGDIHASYSAATEEISFARSYLRMPQTTASLDGTVSRRSSVQLQFQSSDLHEVETVAQVFGLVPQPIGLYGSASIAGTVRGSAAAPQIALQLSAPALKLKGTEWRELRVNVDADPSHVTLRNGDVRMANNAGRLTFEGNVGLDRWTYNETSPLELDVTAARLDVAELKSLAGVQAPVTGALSANISMRGSQLNPTGHGTIDLTNATVADEPIQSANVNFEGAGEQIRARLALRMTAGAVQADITYFPKTKAYNGQLQSAGIRLDQLRTLRARNIQVAGVLSLNAKGQGTFEDPAVEFTAQIPQLQIQDQTITGLTLQANVADHVANVKLDSQALNTFIRGQGTVNLTGDYMTDASIDTSAISLQPLLAVYLPAQAADLTGATEMHGSVRGPLKDKSALDAHVTLPTLSLTYKNNIKLAAAQPIHVDYVKGVLTLQKTEIRAPGTDLQLQGTFPVAGTSPISLLALGTIDLQVAQMFVPDMVSSGQIQFNVDGYGQRANPNVQGQIKIVNASFAGGDLPLGLQNGNGVLSLTGDRLEIEQFQGNVGGGTLTAKGGVTYRPSPQFNIVLAANGLRMLYPQGVREGVDANLTLTGSMESALLRGQVQLTDLSFASTFDLDDILSQAGGAAAVPPQGLARNVQLDISVQSTSDLDLASSKLSVQGAANLRVRGTAAEPVVLGRVNLTGGDLIYRGNRYILQPSTLDFVNPYRLEPRVNLAVETEVQSYNIQLLFRGTMDQLRTTYSSEPPLPPSDIINLLVFGKTTEAAAANPTPGNLGAKSLIASSISGQATSRLEKIAGISQLSIDPVLGNQQDPGARVTIQQRVTGNLFVTFSTDATSTQRQVIKLEYQATPRVALSGVRDQNGGLAVDVKIRKSW